MNHKQAKEKMPVLLEHGDSEWFAMFKSRSFGLFRVSDKLVQQFGSTLAEGNVIRRKEGLYTSRKVNSIRTKAMLCTLPSIISFPSGEGANENDLARLTNHMKAFVRTFQHLGNSFIRTSSDSVNRSYLGHLEMS